jgi:hypothetical protein
MRTLHVPRIDELLEAVLLYVIVVPAVIAVIVSALIFITDI